MASQKNFFLSRSLSLTARSVFSSSLSPGLRCSLRMRRTSEAEGPAYGGGEKEQGGIIVAEDDHDDADDDEKGEQLEVEVEVRVLTSARQDEELGMLLPPIRCRQLRATERAAARSSVIASDKVRVSEEEEEEEGGLLSCSPRANSFFVFVLRGRAFLPSHFLDFFRLVLKRLWAERGREKVLLVALARPLLSPALFFHSSQRTERGHR